MGKFRYWRDDHGRAFAKPKVKRVRLVRHLTAAQKRCRRMAKIGIRLHNDDQPATLEFVALLKGVLLFRGYNGDDKPKVANVLADYCIRSQRAFRQQQHGHRDDDGDQMAQP